MSLFSTDTGPGSGAFVPPFPPRLPSSPSTLKRLLIARRDFLEMWEDEAFELEFSHSRMFLRQTFLCNSPESVQFAFSQKNASFQRKSPQMRYALAPLLGDGLFVSDGQTWKTRRRIVAPIVHISRVPEFAPVMVEAAIETRERWGATQGSTIDVLAESAELTAEIICRTLFGRKLGEGYAGQIVRGFSNYQRAIDQIDLISFLGLPDWFPRWHGRRVRHNVGQIHAVLDEVVASARARAGDGEPSVINHLFEARDENGAPLDSEALRNEIAVLFMAGHETTANTLAWTWYLLSQAPQVEAKLHDELDTVLGDRSPTLADLPQLVYTRAILDEALRLYPPVPILPREAITEEEFQGVRIPKGSLLFVVPWLLHRHRKLWELPDHFIPERFLPENAGKISKFAYVPFSIGPRICAGATFGQTEAILCIATLAQKFKLRLQPGHEVRPVCRLTLRPEGGLPMTVHPRERGMPRNPRPDSPREDPVCPFTHA
jgi:cytochrome P450